MSDQCNLKVSSTIGMSVGGELYLQALKPISKLKCLLYNLFNRPLPTHNVRFIIIEVLSDGEVTISPLSQN